MRTVDPEVWLRGSKYEMRPTDDGLETRLRRSFRDAILEFWRHASLRGTLITTRRCVTMCDTARNVTCAISAFLLALALVSYNIHQMKSRPPLQVNEQSSHTTTDLRFPAVALCSNNLISKASMQAYIKYLLSRRAHNKTYSIDSLEKNILNFGAFVTNTLPQVDVLFMDLLQAKDLKFNVTYLMYKLSPKCSSLMKTCAWQGDFVNCSELFATRITPLGFCCVFNARYRPEDVNAATWSVPHVGQSPGLLVVCKEEDEDFAYVRRPALGVEALIFDGDEYPLLETGVAHLYPVQRHSTMLFSLKLRDVKASPDLTSYSDNWRQCRIREPRGRSADSSFGWCLLECRRRTVAALCNCVPFTLMPDDEDTVCTPNHLPCLNKHKEKFLYLYPGEDGGDGLTEEIQDSLACESCLPDCDRPFYSAEVALTSYDLSLEKKFSTGRILEGSSLANTTTLRFFYSSNHQPWFAVEPAVRWYEGVATIACHWVLLLTITLITFIELLFHVTVRWLHHFRRRTARVNNHGDTSKTDHTADVELDHDIIQSEETEFNINDNSILKTRQHKFYF